MIEKSALIIVDVQNDFCKGSLAVPGGEEIIPILNEYIRKFLERGLPIYATRDWHPPNHISFRKEGGRWPTHCVQGSDFAFVFLISFSYSTSSKIPGLKSR